jgi:hypothetical protein
MVKNTATMVYFIKPTIFSLFIVVLVSCNSSNQNKPVGLSDPLNKDSQEVREFPSLEPGVVNITETDFGETIELVGTPVTTDALFDPRELEMMVRGDMLIMKAHAKTGLIKFLKLPNLKVIKETGIKGQGPGELLFPMLIATSEPGLLCYLYDMQQEKVYQIDTAFALSETMFPLEKQENQLFGSKQFVETGSRHFYYVSNSITGKGIYRFWPDTPDSLKLVFDLEEGFKKNLAWSALTGDYTGNREKNRLVYAYKYFHQIRFFDLLSGQKRTVKFEAIGNTDTESSDLRAVLAPTSVTHYWGISAQPDHVYCIYSGRTPLEVGKEFKAGTDHIFIEQYDWNGHPVKRYRLDHWGYFCVDEACRTIYVAAVSADEPMFAYKF